MSVLTLIETVDQYRKENPSATKQTIAAAIARNLGLTKHRSVYASRDFAVRFSSASGKSFSNVVTSLSALKPFDDRPFVIVLLRPTTTEYLLANTTFLRKISHSSHQLRMDNVRGSFLGHDIMRDVNGIENDPSNFEVLFAAHQEFTWEENLARLVEATGNIVGTGQKFAPNPQQAENILRAPAIARELSARYKYQELKADLDQIVKEKHDKILELGRIDNVNVRGNQIEQLITGGINEHKLADIVRETGGIEISLEIKTKLMDRTSSPKAYNIDKALSTLAKGNSAIAFCFIGIALQAGKVTSSTVSILDKTIIGATRIQFHWAGRNSRGVTQLAGDFGQVFSPNYKEEIDEELARRFLQRLLDL